MTAGPPSRNRAGTPSGDEHSKRIGEVLQNRYRVVGHIADGGMASVYKGERLELARPVAIKFLRSPYVSSKHFMKRFEREARALSRLSHPHCVSVFDFGFADAPYLVMDYVVGISLRELLDRGRLSTARALRIMRQILAGLAHAHGQGIVHRDIKPANAVLTEATGTGDFVRLLDFGLAKLRGGGASGISRVTDIVVGTPSYMSPEQSRGDHVDPRSDVYSAGVLMFELLTGNKPFVSDDAFEVLTMQREDPLPPLATATPDRSYSAELQAVLTKATRKDPRDRFQSAIDFLDELASVPETRARVRRATSGDHEELALADPAFAVPSITNRVRRAPRSRFGLSVLALILLVCGIAAGAWHFTQQLDRERTQASAQPVVAGDDDGDDDGDDVEPYSAPINTDSAADDDDDEAAFYDDAVDDDDAIEQAEMLFPPDELDEPIAPVPDGDSTTDEEVDTELPPDGDDVALAAATDEPPPAAPVTGTATFASTSRNRRKPVTVQGIDDVKLLLAEGRRAEAISGLRKLRKRNPKSAYIPYLLGNLYFEQRWWSAGLDAYDEAIANNRSYRKRSILNKNVIRALGSNKTVRKASLFVRQRIGQAALPHLRAAAKRDGNPKVRRRAKRLVKMVAPKAKRSKKRSSRSNRRRRRR